MSKLKEAENLRGNPIKPLNRFSRIRRTQNQTINRKCKNCKRLGATEDFVHYVCGHENVILNKEQLENSECDNWKDIQEKDDCKNCKHCKYIEEIYLCTKRNCSVEAWSKFSEVHSKLLPCEHWESNKETQCCWNCNERKIDKNQDSFCQLHEMKIRNWVEKQCNDWKKVTVFV